MAGSTKFQPGITYQNVCGSKVNIRTGPGINYSTTGNYIQPNSTILITERKGDWVRIGTTDMWAAVQYGGERLLKQISDNNSTSTKPTQQTQSNHTKDPIQEPAQNQNTKSASDRKNAENSANNERKKHKRTTGEETDTIPYQDWKNLNWVPQDELYSDNSNGAPSTFTGQSRESMQELQRISQQDFIIQPNLRKEKRFGMFDRVGILDPTAKIISTKEYVFFTKPDLYIFKDKNGNALNDGKDVDGQYMYDGLAGIPIFDDALVRYKDVLAQLQSSVALPNYYYNSPFMNILTNNIKSPIDLPAITAEETETAKNAYGTSITYRDSSEKSDEGFEFSIEFEDTKYLEVYMLFKLYDEYERKKKLGIVGPKEEYITNKIIHDQFAVYKFVVGEDGESLIYWAKFYGVYPKGVPRDVMNEIGADGKVRFTVPFKCQFMDDQDPQILADFNDLTNPDAEYTAKMSMPAMDPETQMGNIRFGMVPFITLDQIDENRADVWERVNRYKLRWLEDVNDKSQHRYFDPESYINDTTYKSREELQSEIDREELGYYRYNQSGYSKAASQMYSAAGTLTDYMNDAMSAIRHGTPFTGR